MNRAIGLSSEVPLMLHTSAIIGRHLLIFEGSANKRKLITDEIKTNNNLFLFHL